MTIRKGTKVWLNPGENFCRGVVLSVDGVKAKIVTRRGAKITVPICDLVVII